MTNLWGGAQGGPIEAKDTKLNHRGEKVPSPVVSDLAAGRDARNQTKLVLTDRSPLTEGRDFGVIVTRSWRLADLGAKHALLLAGLGQYARADRSRRPRGRPPKAPGPSTARGLLGG
jgi:hypothetical protein